MRIRNLKQPLAWAILVLAAATPGAAVQHRQDLSLLHRATRVIHLGDGASPLLWLSDHQLIIGHSDPLKWYSYNPETRRQTPTDALPVGKREELNKRLDTELDQLDQYRAQGEAWIRWGWTNRHGEPPHHLLVQPPQEAHINNVVELPARNRIAWLLGFERFSEPVRLADQVLPKCILPARATDEIWVSQSDGQGMHELGYVDRSPGSKSGLSPMLRWSPDGRWLSFEYKDSAWVIRAD